MTWLPILSQVLITISVLTSAFVVKRDLSQQTEIQRQLEEKQTPVGEEIRDANLPLSSPNQNEIQAIDPKLGLTQNNPQVKANPANNQELNSAWSNDKATPYLQDTPAYKDGNNILTKEEHIQRNGGERGKSDDISNHVAKTPDGLPDNPLNDGDDQMTNNPTFSNPGSNDEDVISSKESGEVEDDQIYQSYDSIYSSRLKDLAVSAYDTNYLQSASGDLSSWLTADSSDISSISSEQWLNEQKASDIPEQPKEFFVPQNNPDIYHRNNFKGPSATVKSSESSGGSYMHYCFLLAFLVVIFFLVCRYRKNNAKVITVKVEEKDTNWSPDYSAQIDARAKELEPMLMQDEK